MRKNFLILMLMALLPLAGWAADLSLGTIVAPSPYYGVEPDPANLKVYNEAGDKVLVADYSFVGYFSDAACNTEVTASAIAAANAGARFYVKVIGVNGYEGTLIGSFEVKPMPLTVAVTNSSKTYLDEDPDAATFAALKSGVTIFGGAAAPAAVNSAVTVTGRDGDENAGAKKYTATLAGQPNYVIGDITGTFTINPKAFKKADPGSTITITVTAGFTFNGKNQEATVVVKDKATGATLVKGKDYTLVYAGNTNAGVNTASVTVTGKGNYAATANVEYYSIAAAPLLVTPSAKRVYDGTTALVAIPANVGAFQEYDESVDPVVPGKKFTFQGFVEEDPADPSWTVTTTWAGTAVKKDVGTYKLNINAGNDIDLANYAIELVEGTFEITQREITVTPDDKLNQEYGSVIAYTWALAGEVGSETADVNAVLKMVPSEEPNEKGEYTITPTFKTSAEIEAYVKDVEGLSGDAAKNRKNALVQLVANYKIKGGKTGKLTYNKAPLKIALNESKYTLTKVYDGQPFSVALNKTDGLTFIGLKNGEKASDVVNTENLVLTYNETATAAGAYQLTLSGATADNYVITYIPSQFKIAQRPLKVKIYNQTFITGEVPTLNATLYDVESGKANEGLAAGDKATEVFKLDFAGTITFDGDGKITNVANNYADAIIAVASNGDPTKTKWANYDLSGTNVTKGTAKIVAADVVALDDTDDLLANVLNVEHGGATVTFNARKLNAEQWNVLVLPFDITVKDLSTAFGYAVIDVLDETATDGNAHFKLKVNGKIDANTPFMIYPCEDYNNLNQIVFTGVNVKKVTTATVEKADKGGNKFVGTYATTGIYGQDFRYMSKGTWYDARNFTESSPCNIKALRGYLDMSGSTSAAPMIYIEEPNGNVTAIETVSAAKVANSNDAIYNLAGQKVGADYKGIVIKNGKRFVQK